MGPWQPCPYTDGTSGAARASGTERCGVCVAFVVALLCRGMAVALPCGGTMTDELGSCRAISLAAAARHAAAESAWRPGSRQGDGSSSSSACTTAKASRALDFFVGDIDRRDRDGDIGRGGGFFAGDSERLTSSREEPPGLNGLRLPPSSFACTAANPLLRLLGQSGLSTGDLDRGDGDGDGDGDGGADRDGALSGLERFIPRADARGLLAKFAFV